MVDGKDVVNKNIGSEKKRFVDLTVGEKEEHERENELMVFSVHARQFQLHSFDGVFSVHTVANACARFGNLIVFVARKAYTVRCMVCMCTFGTTTRKIPNAEWEPVVARKREKIGISMPCYFIHESVLNLTNYIIYPYIHSHISILSPFHSIPHTHAQILHDTICQAKSIQHIPGEQNESASESS